MARMSTGQAVVESLLAQGVDTVFGIISVHTLHIYDALKDKVHDGRIRFVGARHEHALAFMADGYARATGKIGVLLTSSGPGAADSVGAIGESFHSSIPILQITTEVEHGWVNSRRGVTHEAKDQLEMFGSVADWKNNAATPLEVPSLIADAMYHLRTSHPRPALLSIPTNFLAEEHDFEIIPSRPIVKPIADSQNIDSARQLLETANRPLIVAGGGVMRANATHELLELAEALNAPVAVADGGKGAFPEDHPLALGTLLGGRVWGDNPIQDYAGTCDAALIVGTSLPWRSTEGVGLKLPADLIHIDIDPTMFDRNYEARIKIQGDAKFILEDICSALSSSGHRPTIDRINVEALKFKAQASVAEQFPNELAAWQAIREAIPRETILFLDSTIPAYVAQRCFTTLEPRTYNHPHGWVSIGYAFAACLGGQVGLPDRQVLCVTGDGGFQYNLQELGSAIQYGIAPVVLIFNDEAWGVLKRYQDQRFDGRKFATDLQNPDFERLAAAYGVGYHSVETVGELSHVLQTLRKPDILQLVEVRIPNGFANFR